MYTLEATCVLPVDGRRSGGSWPECRFEEREEPVILLFLSFRQTISNLSDSAFRIRNNGMLFSYAGWLGRFEFNIKKMKREWRNFLFFISENSLSPPNGAANAINLSAHAILCWSPGWPGSLFRRLFGRWRLNTTVQ